jgi:hypothetical protein
MNDETLEHVTRAILPAFTHIEDEDYRATIAGCWARAAIEALEEMGWGPEEEWPEPGPNAIFKPHTITTIPIDKIHVDVVLPEPDPKQEA